MPEVSVVIPSYNHEQFIGVAVDSVLGQDLADLELIVIDDGSQDGSVDLLAGYQDSRLQLVCQENAGADAAINLGLSMATGDFLTILNSDDVYLPARLSCLVAALKDRGGGLASSYIEIIDDAGVALGIKEAWRNMHPWDLGEQGQGDDAYLQLLLANYIATTSNMVFTREVYEQVGGMRPYRFVHDWDFLFRVCAQYPLVMIESPLMQYRVHGSNTISSNRAWMQFEICLVQAANMGSYLSGRKFFDVDALDTLFAGINFAGNDRLVWLLMAYLDARQRSGDEDALVNLLRDPEQVERFTAMVADEPADG